MLDEIKDVLNEQENQEVNETLEENNEVINEVEDSNKTESFTLENSEAIEKNSEPSNSTDELAINEEDSTSDAQTQELINETMEALGIENNEEAIEAQEIVEENKDEKIEEDAKKEIEPNETIVQEETNDAHIAEEPIKEETKEETIDKKENKKLVEPKSTKIKRIILWSLTIYFDLIALYFLIIKSYLFNFIFYRLSRRSGLIGFILIVFLLIVNILNLVLIRDTRKIKKKNSDDILPIIDDAEYIDGRLEEIDESHNIDLGIDGAKEVKYRASKTINPIDIKKTVDDFILFLNENGLLMDKKNARELLASIASNKLIFVDDVDREILKKLFSLITLYFGTEYHFIDSFNRGANNPVYLGFDSNGYTDSTDFLKGIVAAKKNPQKLNFDFIYGFDFNIYSKYIPEVFEFAKNPELASTITVGTNTVEIDKNTWFIFTIGENIIIPEDIIKYAIRLNIQVKETTPLDSKLTRKSMDTLELVDAISEAYEFYYVKEETWKKLDEFNDYLKDRGEYEIDNRIQRSMEKYSAFYLASDGEESDLIDTLLSKKLLLIAINSNFKSKDNDEESLVGIAEKILGADYITNAQELLKKIKMD